MGEHGCCEGDCGCNDTNDAEFANDKIDALLDLLVKKGVITEDEFDKAYDDLFEEGSEESSEKEQEEGAEEDSEEKTE